MDSKESIKILDQCIKMLQDISEEEFTAVLKDKGLLNKDYSISDCGNNFEVIFPSINYVFEQVNVFGFGTVSDSSSYEIQNEPFDFDPRCNDLCKAA